MRKRENLKHMELESLEKEKTKALNYYRDVKAILHLKKNPRK